MPRRLAPQGTSSARAAISKDLDVAVRGERIRRDSSWPVYPPGANVPISAPHLILLVLRPHARIGC